MRLLLVVLLAAVLPLSGCGAAPEPAAEASSAFTCDQSTSVSNGHDGFVSVCLHYAPSRPPTGGPCGGPLPDGYAEAHTLPGYAGYCTVLAPGYYTSLGDWDTAAYQIRSLRTGPRAYAFSFSTPNFGTFAALDIPGAAEPDTTAWSLSSLELLLGQ